MKGRLFSPSFYFLLFTCCITAGFLQTFIFSLFHTPHREKIGEITGELRLLIKGYVKGLSSLVVLLVLGIKYALLMAVFAGVLNLIPYIGVYTATAVNALITLTTANSTKAIEVAACFILIHIIDANIILPRIVGGSVKMNPFITLIAVVAGI